MKKNKKVTLFCGKGDCCPTLTFYKDHIEIIDDFGGKTTLTNDQYEVLKDKVRNGEI